MKILITGAEGFIGIHLINHLLKKHEVIPIDYRHGDLTQIGVADEIIKSYKPDVVIHLAAQVGIYFNECDCVHSINSNVVMTLLVAQACERYGAKLIHTSTSEVYGDFGDRLIDEDEPLIGKPTGIYALSKRWSEDAAREYCKNTIIIRPSMPYGHGCPPGKGRRAMDNMLWQAHHRKPITVHRNSVRSWCHISDVVRGYEMIINEGQGVFNIGRDDDERSMLWIAEESCRIAGAPKDLIIEVDPPINKTMVKRLSTKKLQTLGWRPEIEIEQGMKEVYEWVKQFPFN